MRKLGLTLSLALLTLLASAATAAAAGSTYSATISTTPGLAGYWRLGEQGSQADADGMTAADALGANPATYHLGINLGQSGALERDSDTSVHLGSPDGYITIPYSPTLNTPTFTFEAWVRFDVNAEWMVIASNGEQAGILTGYSIQTVDDWGNANLGLWIGTIQIKGVDIAPGRWYYLAATYDGSMARLYIDGQLKGAQATVYTPNTTRPTTLGLNPIITNAGQLFGGLDEVAIYNTALSPTTIQQHYQAGITDGSPPQTSIDAAPSGVTNQTSASFSFGSSSVDASFQCQLDGGVWSTCSSPFSVGGLADGSHRMAIRAVNRAGQVDPSPPTAAWTVVTAAPQTNFETGPAAVTNATEATFTFTAATASAFTCQLDGGPALPCASPYHVSGLADGPHSLAVQASDQVGNQAAPAVYQWQVDTAAPVAFITDAPTTANPFQSFAFRANKSGVAFECSFDYGVWRPCASPLAWVPSGIGTQTFEVRAGDGTGNVGPVAEYVWNVASTRALSLQVSFPHRVMAMASERRRMAQLRPRCRGKAACIASLASKYEPHIGWRASTPGRIAIRVLDSHKRTIFRSNFTLRIATGEVVMPETLWRRLRAGRAYVAFLQAASGGSESALVRVSFSVSR